MDRKQRDSQNIYDTPKVSSVKWKEDLSAAYERSRAGRKDAKPVAAVNTSLLQGDSINRDVYVQKCRFFCPY